MKEFKIFITDDLKLGVGAVEGKMENEHKEDVAWLIMYWLKVHIHELRNEILNRTDGTNPNIVRELLSEADEIAKNLKED